MTPLHAIGSFLRELLLQVPLAAVQALFVALPIAVLIWVLLLPRKDTTPPEGSGRWDENLKLGASIALIAQVLIYTLL